MRPLDLIISDTWWTVQQNHCIIHISCMLTTCKTFEQQSYLCHHISNMVDSAALHNVPCAFPAIQFVVAKYELRGSKLQYKLVYVLLVVAKHEFSAKRNRKFHELC